MISIFKDSQNPDNPDLNQESASNDSHDILLEMRIILENLEEG